MKGTHSGSEKRVRGKRRPTKAPRKHIFEVLDNDANYAADCYDPIFDRHFLAVNDLPTPFDPKD